MSEIISLGLNLAKNVLQVHGIDSAGRTVLRKKLRRVQVLEFLLNCRLVLWRWKPAGTLIYAQTVMSATVASGS